MLSQVLRAAKFLNLPNATAKKFLRLRDSEAEVPQVTRHVKAAPTATTKRAWDADVRTYLPAENTSNDHRSMVCGVVVIRWRITSRSCYRRMFMIQGTGCGTKIARVGSPQATDARYGNQEYWDPVRGARKDVDVTGMGGAHHIPGLLPAASNASHKTGHGSYAVAHYQPEVCQS